MLVLGNTKTDLFPLLQRQKSSLKAVLIGGSAGSFSVTNRLLEVLPPTFPYPLIVVLHRLKDKREGFREALQIRTRLRVLEPDDKTPIGRGNVYIAPANYHLLLETPDRFALATTDLVQYSRPSIDVLFDSAADVYKDAVLAILLSGANRDGASGLARIHRKGGLTVVQDPSDCTMPTMPQAALRLLQPTWMLLEKQISQLLAALAE